MPPLCNEVTIGVYNSSTDSQASQIHFLVPIPLCFVFRFIACRVSLGSLRARIAWKVVCGYQAGVFGRDLRGNSLCGGQAGVFGRELRGKSLS